MPPAIGFDWFIRGRRLGAALLLALVCLVPVSAQDQKKPVPPLPAKDRAKAFQEVWEGIRDQYVDYKLRGLDWEAVRKKYEPLAQEAKTDDDFWEILDRMALTLNDAHTRVLPPLHSQLWLRRGAHPAFRLAAVQNDLVVTEVFPKTDAESTGVRPGMILTAVDGVTVFDALTKAVRETPVQSSPQATRLAVVENLCAGRVGTNVSLRFMAPDGKFIDTILLRAANLDAEAPVSSKVLPSGAGYIRIATLSGESYADEISERFKSHLRKLEKCKGIVIDLRHNGGGSLSEVLDMLGYFIQEPKPVFNVVLRGIPQRPVWSLLYGRLYRGKVVVLTDSGTASAAEALSYALQEHVGATIIGTRTCGCVLGFLGYQKVKGGGYFSVSESAFFTLQGQLLERVGVVPNRLIEPKREDYIQGRDPWMIEAEKVLAGPLR